MFCPLERIELKTNYCPVSTCVYKDNNNACQYDRLTKDEVTVNDVAETRGIKVYKARALANQAREAVAKGLVIKQYSEYLKNSFPHTEEGYVEIFSHTVNESEGHVHEILQNVFGLSKYQQQKFWDADRYAVWATRSKVQYTLDDLQAALIQADPNVT